MTKEDKITKPVCLGPVPGCMIGIEENMDELASDIEGLEELVKYGDEMCMERRRGDAMNEITERMSAADEAIETGLARLYDALTRLIQSDRHNMEAAVTLAFAAREISDAVCEWDDLRCLRSEVMLGT